MLRHAVVVQKLHGRRQPDIVAFVNSRYRAIRDSFPSVTVLGNFLAHLYELGRALLPVEHDVAQQIPALLDAQEARLVNVPDRSGRVESHFPQPGREHDPAPVVVVREQALQVVPRLGFGQAVEHDQVFSALEVPKHELRQLAVAALLAELRSRGPQELRNDFPRVAARAHICPGSNLPIDGSWKARSTSVVLPMPAIPTTATTFSREDSPTSLPFNRDSSFSSPTSSLFVLATNGPDRGPVISGRWSTRSDPMAHLQFVSEDLGSCRGAFHGFGLEVTGRDVGFYGVFCFVHHFSDLGFKLVCSEMAYGAVRLAGKRVTAADTTCRSRQCC
ncbi:oxoglutarate dehydrogenase [Striga asiatica]|uniref:Oxoglutarate dehydrogenase n=1 Tax=Striga asiatica TaxID=4170 RepID=A0A5A7PNH1_STRAF|nr:oxoglutarate dehydrogenase [Striga asiatica]